MNHLVTTSNKILFINRAELIFMREQRKLMELLLFLCCNKYLWNEATIDDIIVGDDV